MTRWLIGVAVVAMLSSVGHDLTSDRAARPQQPVIVQPDAVHPDHGPHWEAPANTARQQELRDLGADRTLTNASDALVNVAVPDTRDTEAEGGAVRPDTSGVVALLLSLAVCFCTLPIRRGASA